MVRGRDKWLWNHTASVLAKLHNANWTKQMGPKDFHPHLVTTEVEKPRKVDGKAFIDALWGIRSTRQ